MPSHPRRGLLTIMAEAPAGANAAQAAGSKRKRSNILGMAFFSVSPFEPLTPILLTPLFTDLVSDLERRLPSIKGDTVAAAALTDHVRRRILQKDLNRLDEDGDAHKAGVLLWNLVLRLERDAEKTTKSTAPAEYRRLLLHSRVLAFVIIDRSTCPEVSSTNRGEDPSAGSQMIYLLSIAVRAAKACIGK